MAMTIPELFEGAVAQAPDSRWLLHEDDSYTYAQAHTRIGRAAAALAERGVSRGDLVLAAPRNLPEYLFLWLGAMYLGAIYVGIDPRSTETEFQGFVTQVEPKLVVRDDDLEGLFAGDAPRPDGPGPAQPDDAAVLIPTSGTTGRSKLVTQTQRAYAMAGEGFPWWLELHSDDRLMTSLPLFHINAPAYSVLGSVAARASLVLLPGFSAGTFLDSARRFGATEFNAIGAMLEILMRQPERPDDADNPLRLCYTGPLPPGSASSRSRRASACGSCAATRCRRRPRRWSGTAARGPTGRWAACASTRRWARSTRRAWWTASCTCETRR